MSKENDSYLTTAFRKSFCLTLPELMEQYNLNRSDIARISSSSVYTVDKWLNGTRTIGMEKFIALHEYFVDIATKDCNKQVKVAKHAVQEKYPALYEDVVGYSLGITNDNNGVTVIVRSRKKVFWKLYRDSVFSVDLVGNYADGYSVANSLIQSTKLRWQRAE